jgi:hypothetical protein
MRITIEQTNKPPFKVGMSITKLILETDDDLPSYEDLLGQVIIPLMNAYGYDTRDIDEMLYPTTKPQEDEE